MCHSSLVVFNILNMSGYYKFNYEVFLAWISLSLLCMGFVQLLEFIGLAIFEKFSAIIIIIIIAFEFFFSPTLFLLSFWDSHDVNVGSFVILQISKALFIFFKLYSSLLFRLDEIYLSILKFTDFILCNLHCTIEFIQ